MATHKEKDQLEEQKEKLFEVISDLQESLDLDEEDVQKIKEWGAGLLIAGVSAYVLFKLFKSMSKGTSIEVENRRHRSPKVKMKRESSVSRLLKEQIVVILIAVFRKRIMRFLRENDIIDED
ncbi:hypothetical protein [Catalinimonas niigatensis]|uniref:hypothetical protein n=1 Tax=Catalinimonas niigatensis TaxID=1397264 RepID=UPI0026664DE2|nr:hypothetical protein [Catalinimonas niigatensis]WPP49430.1 hypothetical protein PZB72_22420 [Catalinimonas niigatensis]